MSMKGPVQWEKNQRPSYRNSIDEYKSANLLDVLLFKIMTIQIWMNIQQVSPGYNKNIYRV